MNDSQLFEGPFHPGDEYAKLARWLQQLMQIPQRSKKAPGPGVGDMQLELLLDSDYHLHFYRQLPDFVMALLNDDPKATISFAPLLYHLAGCSECHSSYLDLYDSLRAAIDPQEARPLLGQGTRTLAGTPHRMLGHLCQTLISQAEAALREARRAHNNDDVVARSLLQLALHISARISQSNVRRYALHDLVRVATLSEGPGTPKEDDPDVFSFTPTLTGAGTRRGKKIVRRADMLSRSTGHEAPGISLQARGLEGTITQHGQMLELHLEDLAPTLRGHYVVITVPLGSLIEPIRWIGGNPRAIRSATPVDDTGSLTTALGQTDLHLTNPEDRNLLEAMFLLLEVRSAGDTSTDAR